MDRRRFAKLIVAAVLGVRVGVELLPAQPLLLLEDARTNEWDVSPEIDNASWAKQTGGYLVHEDFAEAIEADLLLYGNAYRRPGGVRIAPGDIDVEKLASGWSHIVVRHA